MSCGIYQIKHRDSTRRYIGSSKQIEFRWSCHIWDLDRGVHVNLFLQNLWNKYGKDAFEFSIVEYCPESELLRIEQCWIDSIPVPDRINISLSTVGGMRGRHHTEEAKQKMREANTGQKRPPRSDMTRQRMSESRLGKTKSTETKQKMSESMKLAHERRRLKG